MKKLKIEIPKGFIIDEFNKDTGVIKFKKEPKNVMQSIKTIEDVLIDNSISEAQFKTSCLGLSEDEIAYRLIKLICKSLNEGWVPDWGNANEYKYFPWFYMSSSGFRFDGYVGWSTNANVGSRLSFKSQELATHAGNQFTEIYKNYLLIK